MRCRLLLVIGALGLLGSGCVTVQPWERERLARPDMELGARLGDGYRAHVLSIREGSVGGDRTAGGGCGCT